jgi:hypothetical protein
MLGSGAVAVALWEELIGAEVDAAVYRGLRFGERKHGARACTRDLPRQRRTPTPRGSAHAAWLTGARPYGCKHGTSGLSPHGLFGSIPLDDGSVSGPSYVALVFLENKQ